MSSQQPVAKRQKTYDADGPVEEDEAAREKLRRAGFDPDDVHTAMSDVDGELFGFAHFFMNTPNITPMAYFSYCEDLPMCRYLHHVRGAVTTRAAQEHLTEPAMGVRWHPIYAAAYDCRDIEIVKWLYKNGAESELLMFGTDYSVDDSSAMSTLFYFLCKNGVFSDCLVDFIKSLVMEGFLEDDLGNTNRGDGTKIDDFLLEMEREVGYVFGGDMNDVFLGWMEELLAPNYAFHIFLLGTARKPQYSVAGLKKIVAKRLGNVEAASMLVDGAVANGNSHDIWDQLMGGAGRPSSHNACLASFPGVLEKIADYVGIIKRPELRRIEDARDAAKETKDSDSSSS